jgi:heavy metal efflux system protein
MIAWVLAFSVRRRWYVLLFTVATALSGAWALTVLPIDAVPDITNVQVQVNAFAPALSPLEVEKQVTFPIEVALAGTPGLEKTWSFSRNGFAQVTAVFGDRTDVYFARQQVTERLSDAKSALPPGVEVKMGPISTGLGEVYWWTVEYAPPGKEVREGVPGWQPDGSSTSTTSCHASSTCAPSRTGSSGRSSRPCGASPGPMRSEASSSNTMWRLTSRSSSATACRSVNS